MLKDSVIRTILGVPMILFIPGYVSMATLFPKKDDLDAIERTVLSFGFSIAVVPLLGLILNFAFEIRLIPIITILCIYTIILATTAIYKRMKLPEDVQFSVQFSRIYDVIKSETNIPKNRTGQILTIILIFSIVLVIGVAIYVVTTPKIGERFTEFYILNSTSGKADNYPTELNMDIPTTLLVRVVNHEYSFVNYTFQVSLDKNILTSEKLALNNNETWKKNISFVTNKEVINKRLEFLLFKENNFASPYRELHLWVNVT